MIRDSFTKLEIRENTVSKRRMDKHINQAEMDVADGDNGTNVKFGAVMVKIDWFNPWRRKT